MLPRSVGCLKLEEPAEIKDIVLLVKCVYHGSRGVEFPNLIIASVISLEDIETISFNNIIQGGIENDYKMMVEIQSCIKLKKFD